MAAAAVFFLVVGILAGSGLFAWGAAGGHGALILAGFLVVSFSIMLGLRARTGSLSDSGHGGH